jgi:hypothetical protein
MSLGSAATTIGGEPLLIDVGQLLGVPLLLPLPGGFASAGTTLPPGLPDLDLFMQFFVLDPGAPNGEYAATNAVRVELSTL